MRGRRSSTTSQESTISSQVNARGSAAERRSGRLAVGPSQSDSRLAVEPPAVEVRLAWPGARPEPRASRSSGRPRASSRLDRRQRTWQAGERRGRPAPGPPGVDGLGLLGLDQRRPVEVDRAEAVAGRDVIPGREPVGQLLRPASCRRRSSSRSRSSRVRPSPSASFCSAMYLGSLGSGANALAGMVERLAGLGSTGLRLSSSASGLGISVGSKATVTITIAVLRGALRLLGLVLLLGRRRRPSSRRRRACPR